MDFYATLKVAKTATPDEIRKAYKAECLKWHPDRNSAPEATAKFKQIAEACETLGNPGKRADYDRNRSLAVHKSVDRSRSGRMERSGFSGDAFRIFEEFTRHDPFASFGRWPASSAEIFADFEPLLVEAARVSKARGQSGFSSSISETRTTRTVNGKRVTRIERISRGSNGEIISHTISEDTS